MGFSTHLLPSLLGFHLSMALSRLPSWEGRCLDFTYTCVCVCVSIPGPTHGGQWDRLRFRRG